jgi:sugar/nucleoside kinase (ribokinase family)
MPTDSWGHIRNVRASSSEHALYTIYKIRIQYARISNRSATNHTTPEGGVTWCPSLLAPKSIKVGCIPSSTRALLHLLSKRLSSPSDLHKDAVDTSLVGYSKTHSTGYSCLLLSPSGERTILTYRGASTHYEIKESDFHDTKADWIYLSSLEGNFEVLETVFAYAEHHKIKIAMNPGKKELEDKDRLKALLPKLTVLSLNLDEMKMLYHGDNREDLIRAAIDEVPFVVVTDGPNGASASDGKHIVHAGMYEDVPVIDRTGAGDAFGSGFLSAYAQGKSLKEAIVFASANSTSVVQFIGAKEGILHEGTVLHT